ncbi:MAG TPA: ectonucleotide pyrophosphatase/phosphodiesterase [Longimicrobiales bacterium]
MGEGCRSHLSRPRRGVGAIFLAALAAAPSAAFAQGGSGGRNAPEHLDAPYVVVVSFDGFRHDYLDRFETPNFDRVARRGVRADALIPIFPSKTFPNHYAIATGMYAESHGLVGNDFWDPEFEALYRLADRSAVQDGRWYGGEPIWVTAERQGMVAASFFFVGSEAAIGGVRPTEYRVYDGSVPNEARVDQVLDWLRRPAPERPHLVMLYFSDVDGAGHRYGPDSPEVERAVETVDRALGRLLDGIDALDIADEVYVVLVSDHGMQAVSAERVEYIEDLVDLAGVRILGGGPYLTLWIDGAPERVREIEAALNDGLRHARAYRREAMPERWRYAGSPRVGSLIVLAEPGWQVLGSRERTARGGGAHGYDPATTPAMRGIFLAAGPAIRSGLRIPAVENVHVYPLLAHLLGLRPNPEIDGRLEVLEPILEPAPAVSTTQSTTESPDAPGPIMFREDDLNRLIEPGLEGAGTRGDEIAALHAGERFADAGVP